MVAYGCTIFVVCSAFIFTWLTPVCFLNVILSGSSLLPKVAFVTLSISDGLMDFEVM